LKLTDNNRDKYEKSITTQQKEQGNCNELILSCSSQYDRNPSEIQTFCSFAAASDRYDGRHANGERLTAMSLTMVAGMYTCVTELR
jgi:hypothetical protein